jgi:hypothetical protein
MRFLTLVRLPLFTLHRKCKMIRRLSPPVFWKSVLRLFPSTLYDSNGEMSEYLIVPLAKRQNQLAISKSLPTRTAAPSPREAKAGIVAHLRIDLEDGFAAVVTTICNRVHVCVRLSAVRRFNCAYGARFCACWQVRSRRTGDSPPRSINRRPRALLEAPLAQIRSRSSFPVTA